MIEEQQRAEEEQASQQSLKTIQKAFHEALLALPREEYDWFDIQGSARQEGGRAPKCWRASRPGLGGAATGVAEPAPADSPQREFFEYAGALFRVMVSPAASTTPLNDTRKLKALPRDRSRRRVVEDLTIRVGIGRRRWHPCGRG